MDAAHTMHEVGTAIPHSHALATTSHTALAAQARAVLARGSKTFSLAGVFLPPRSRDAAALVYAFCRLVDDLADDAPSPQVARENLHAIAEELAGRTPARPEVHGFLLVMSESPSGREAADHLLEGVLSDQHPVRVTDDAALLLYCYQVAGAVGVMMCAVLGVTVPRALPHAVDLGIAMQLTNICRDVAEDARMGRVYLPADRLAVHGVTHEALLAGTADPVGVTAVVADLLALAERYYESAEDGMRWIPWRSRLAIVAASRTYRAIGRKLLAQGGNPLLGRTVLSTTEKLPWIGRALLAMGGRRLRGAGPAQVHDDALHRLLPALPGTAKAVRGAVGVR